MLIMITNLAQIYFNVFINLILIDNKPCIYKEFGKVSSVSYSFNTLFYVDSDIRHTEIFHLNQSSDA